MRLLLLAQWSRTPYHLHPQLDDLVHQLWADDILHGELMRPRAFYQSPFYPYLLALVYKLFGVRPLAMLWLQAAAGAATCVVLFRATARLFGQKAGLWAGVMMAFYRPALYQGVFLLKETWLLLALSLFVWTALRLEEEGRGRDAFWSGLALGAAALCKGNALLLAPVLPGMLLLARPTRATLGACALFLLGLALPILPATLHNLAASRDFVLINSTSGFSVFIGNNLEATGTTHYPLGISSQPLAEEKEAAAYAEAQAGRRLKPSEVSRFYLARSVGYALSHPRDWLGLTLTKLMFFWNKYELPDDYDLSFIREHTRTLLSWPLFSFQWAASFGIVGLFLLKKGTTLKVLGGVYMLTVVLSYVTDRYRLPLAVFLLPFAGGLLAELTRAEFRRDWRRHLKPLAAAAPFLLLCNLTLLERTPYDEDQGWVNLAQVYYDRADYPDALDSFYRAARAAPERLGEAAFLCGAAAARAQGRDEEAKTIYRAGLEVHPGSKRLQTGLGQDLPRH